MADSFSTLLLKGCHSVQYPLNKKMNYLERLYLAIHPDSERREIFEKKDHIRRTRCDFQHFVSLP